MKTNKKKARPGPKPDDRRPEILREFFAAALVLAAIKTGVRPRQIRKA